MKLIRLLPCIVVLLLVAVLVVWRHFRSTSGQVERNNLLIISFDGFRYDYLSRKLTPTMYRLASEGVSGHMLSTFATKTFANHHSISTGLYQEAHGIVHNCMYDPVFEEHFRDREDGQSDRWWDNHLSTPIYIANQIYDPASRASCCAPWIGCHVRYFGGQFKARYHRHYNRSVRWDEQLDWALAKMQDEQHPANLAMIYIDEPDHTGHNDGPYGPDTLGQVRRVDGFVGRVVERLASASLLHRTNLILVSDHGLSEVSHKRAIVLDSFLNSSWYDAYGGNPVFTIRPRPGFEGQVYSELKRREIADGHFRVYRREEIPLRFRYRFHRRIHDYLVLADDSWSVHKHAGQLGEQCGKCGQHGYDNQLHSMRPLFIATGPAFKSRFYQRSEFSNVDLYPLMLRLIDIEPNHFYHQGNYSAVVDFLLHKYQ